MAGVGEGGGGGKDGGGSRREELLQTANAVTDMLKQLKAAKEGHKGRGGWGRDGSRGGGRGGFGRDGGFRADERSDGGSGGGARRDGWSGYSGGGGRSDGRSGYSGGGARSDGRSGYSGGDDKESVRWRQRGGGYGGGRDFAPTQGQFVQESSEHPYPRNEKRFRDTSQRWPDDNNYRQRESYPSRYEDDNRRYRGPYQKRQETGRDLWQDEREVGDTLRGQGGARRYHRSNNDNREQVGLSRDRQVEPHQLVKALIGQPTFSVSLLQLMEQQQLTPAAVRATVSRYDLVFCLDGEDVQLRPQLDICAAHCGPSGCQDLTSCTNLHICPKMAVDKCDAEQDCVMGHHWHTNHNLKVLKTLYLESLQQRILAELLQFLYGSDENQSQEPLDICAAYNKSSCSQSDCQQLHICISFVTGRAQCSHTDCQLNHNLLSPSCSPLLKLHGIPTNESPRDIVAALLQANPSLAQASNKLQDTMKKPTSTVSPNNHKEKSSTNISLDKKKQIAKDKISEESDNQSSEQSTDTNSESSDEQQETKHSKNSESSKIISDSSSKNLKTKKHKSEYIKTDDSSGSSESGDEKITDSSSQSIDELSEKKRVKTNKKDTAPTAPRRRTLWSHYLQGDVMTPEICYHSVEDVCKLEGTGCPLLHASHHFHWQVRQKSGRWMNLRPNQVTCIERAFCDASQNGVDLPRLDPATLEMSVSGLLILLGRDVWYADLPDDQNFTLTNTAKTVILELRRLSTQVMPGKPMLPAKYVWYFLDKMQKWVMYGNVDTVGKTNLVSSVTSDDIEKHFLQTPLQPLNFKNSQFTYILDLNTMKQTNQKTNVGRSVRRRPEPHLPNEQDGKKGSEQATATSDLPAQWETMQPEERLRMVTLAPTSDEYQTAVGLLGGSKVSSSNVLKVERVQNPFLWRAFQNKVKELTAVYNDASKVDVRRLFHGTSSNVIASICAENLDWRLHGSASGQMYGRGTYFSTDASYSYNYAKADQNGLRYMFIVKVAVGSMVQGNSAMVRPPPNPATSLPYDSTTDSAGSIIVKYDKQEYFPEFVLTLQ